MKPLVAGVAQPAEPGGRVRVAVEPGPADIAEDHRTEPEEMKELALSVPALLDRPDGQGKAAVKMIDSRQKSAQDGQKTAPFRTGCR